MYFWCAARRVSVGPIKRRSFKGVVKRSDLNPLAKIWQGTECSDSPPPACDEQHGFEPGGLDEEEKRVHFWTGQTLSSTPHQANRRSSPGKKIPRPPDRALRGVLLYMERRRSIDVGVSRSRICNLYPPLYRYSGKALASTNCLRKVSKDLSLTPKLVVNPPSLQ